MGISFVDQIPLSIGTPDEFARIARVLQAAQFTEETICRMLSIKDISEAGVPSEANANFRDASPDLRALMRLFLGGLFVPRAELERVFDSSDLEAFMSLGLLNIGEFGDDDYYAQTLLYPVAGFWIVSDRHVLPDRSKFEPSPETVFPALYTGTLQFLRLLPATEAQEALDLCGGTGIGALVLSRTSKHAVSADITTRATQFALFNRALNNRANVEVACGDLYEPVTGRMFDRITAHPPYVPSVGVNTIWRDGGTTGELLVQRIVEGLPEYLREGGLFCCLTQGLDTEEGTFEERARSWLKEAGDEFDILLACEKERTRQEVLELLAGRSNFSNDLRIQELREAFERAKILKLPYGALFIRRRHSADADKSWTTRRRLSDRTTGDDVEATFNQHTLLSEPTTAERLTQSSPRLSPDLEVKVTHVVHEGSLVPAEYIFETDRPFLLRARFDDWMVPLMIKFDGKLKVADLYNSARNELEIPEGFKLEDFIVFVSRALEGGLLILDAPVGDISLHDSSVETSA